MSDDDEMIPVTAQDIDHTNIQGDISDNKKHFMEISFDGFRICVSTAEDCSLDKFNDSILTFWEKLDKFLVERQKGKKKVRMDPSMEVG